MAPMSPDLPPDVSWLASGKGLQAALDVARLDSAGDVVVEIRAPAEWAPRLAHGLIEAPLGPERLGRAIDVLRDRLRVGLGLDHEPPSLHLLFHVRTLRGAVLGGDGACQQRHRRCDEDRD